MIIAALGLLTLLRMKSQEGFRSYTTFCKSKTDFALNFESPKKTSESNPLFLREITEALNNPARLPLGGYTERLGKLDQPGCDTLYARVICLEQGAVHIVIESVEMLTIPNSLREAVQAKLPKGTFLMLCATHTHCAPDSQMLNRRMTFPIPGIATFNQEQFEWYTDHIAKAANDALRAPAMQITKIEEKSWEAPCNRARRKLAVPDKTAHWIRFIEKTGKTTGIFWYCAHPTFYDANEMKTRGDWPGQVRKIAYLALLGPIGDVSPAAPHPGMTSTEEKLRTPSIRIHEFWNAMLKPLQDKNGVTSTVVWRSGSSSLKVWPQPINLGTPIPNPNFAKTYKIPPSLAKVLVDKFAPEKADIFGFRIGSLAIIGIPGEPSSQIGRNIEAAGKEDGFTTVLPLSHCNGWCGYILLPDDYNRGGYEANLNFYGEKGGLRIQNAAIADLNQLSPTTGKSIKKKR